VFWKSPKKGLIISAELHEKIARNAVSIYEKDSEVISVRSCTKARPDENKSGIAYKPAYYCGA
jgi:hypothetical protein